MTLEGIFLITFIAIYVILYVADISIKAYNETLLLKNQKKEITIEDLSRYLISYQLKSITLYKLLSVQVKANLNFPSLLWKVLRDDIKQEDTIYSLMNDKRVFNKITEVVVLEQGGKELQNTYSIVLNIYKLFNEGEKLYNKIFTSDLTTKLYETINKELHPIIDKMYKEVCKFDNVKNHIELDK